MNTKTSNRHVIEYLIGMAFWGISILGASLHGEEAQKNFPRVTVSGLPIEVENHVVDVELPADEIPWLLGNGKDRAVTSWEVWELDDTGKTVSQKAATFVAAEGGGGTLFWLMDGKTNVGTHRDFELHPSKGPSSTGAVPANFQGVTVRKEGNQIIVSNGIYEVEHDKGKGGSITGLAFGSSTKRLSLKMNDGMMNRALIQDDGANIKVRSPESGKGISLGAVIEVEARYKNRSMKREDGPQGYYRYLYRAHSPVVAMRCRLPEQDLNNTQHRLVQLLSFEFQVGKTFKKPVAIRAGGNGRLMLRPNITNFHGVNTPTIGYFFSNQTEGMAFICPLLSMSAADEENNVISAKGSLETWTGESFTVSGSLLVGSSEKVERCIPLAEEPSVVIQVPSLSARIEAVSLLADKQSPSLCEVARLMVRAAEQRMENLCGLKEAEELLGAAETLVAKANDAKMPVQVVETPSFLALANEQTGILLKTGPQGVSLENISHNGFNFLKPTREGRAFWHGSLCSEDKKQWAHISSIQGKNVQRIIERPEPGLARVKLQWPLLAAGKEKVQAEVFLTLRENDRLSRWQLALQPQGQSLGLWQYEFPSVGGIVGDRRLDTVDFALIPAASGAQWSNPRYGARTSNCYPGEWSFPCLAYYQGKNGLYVSVHDRDAAPKQVSSFSSGEDGFKIETTHWLSNMGKPGIGVKTAFEAVIGTFEGDWYEASLIYREWMVKQDWFPQKTMCQNPDYPQWAKDAVVAWRQSGGWDDQCASVVKNVEEQSKLLGDPPAIFWWYQKMGEPNVTNDVGNVHAPSTRAPPGFAEGVARLRAKNIYTFGYMCCYWWDYTDESWKKEEAEKGVIINVSGNPSLYPKREVGRMCAGSPIYQQRVFRSVNELVDFAPAISGVYFDLGGVGGFDLQACFSTNHNHLPGSGAWRTQAMRDLLYGMAAAVKKRVPDFMTIIESPTEVYLQNSVMALTFTIDVPASSVMYGDYTTPTGMKECMWYPAPVEALLPARQFTFGHLIGRFRGPVMLDVEKSKLDKKLKPEERRVVYDPIKVEFYRRLVRNKIVAKPWLNYGHLLKPLTLSQIQPAGPLEFREDAMIPAAVWRAPDGSLALVFANGRTSTQVSFSYAFDPKAYGVSTDGSQSLFKLTPEGESPKPKFEKITSVKDTINRTETLPPGDVLILVVKDEK